MKFESILLSIRKYTIKSWKHIAKAKRQQRINLENQLKILKKKSG